MSDSNPPAEGQAASAPPPADDAAPGASAPDAPSASPQPAGVPAPPPAAASDTTDAPPAPAPAPAAPPAPGPAPAGEPTPAPAGKADAVASAKGRAGKGGAGKGEKGSRPPRGGSGRKGSARDRGPMRPGVVCRYGMMRQLGLFRHDSDPAPAAGSKVVIRTERGVELGEVVIGVRQEACPHCISPGRLSEYLQANGDEYPFRRDGRVLRPANAQDVIDHRHLTSSANEESTYCRQQIRELKLKMKLVTVEHLLGGERIIFYFSAEQRVDFRELVRRLAAQFRTRIEMRQVGARDEARLVADFERCGQRCCCQQFLKDLKPVSMRMAKTQKATLDPSKISGRCGRLMCCLRYEDAGYEDLRKRLPRRNTWVRTEKCVGRVIETQILTQLVRIVLRDKSVVAVGNEEILERDVSPPAEPAPKESRRRPAKATRDRSERRLLRDQLDSSDAPAAESAPAEAPGQGPPAGKAAQAGEAEPGKRRRRRRSRRKKVAGAGAAQGGKGSGQGDKSAAQGATGGTGQRAKSAKASSGGAEAAAAGGQADPSGGQGEGSTGSNKRKGHRPPPRRKGKRRRGKKPT